MCVAGAVGEWSVRYEEMMYGAQESLKRCVHKYSEFQTEIQAEVFLFLFFFFFSIILLHLFRQVRGEYEGYLMKKERKVWHKRWFVLKDNQFTCIKGFSSLLFFYSL